MSHQLTFADSEFNGKRRKTRKEIFLARMEHCNKAGNRCFPAKHPLRTGT